MYFNPAVACSKDPAQFFAEQLYKSMKGLGTDEDTLNRIMISRCEVDMAKIKAAFKAKYGKTLHSFIKVIQGIISGQSK